MGVATSNSADASVVDRCVGVNFVDSVDDSCLLDALAEVVMSRDGLLSIFCRVIVAVFLCSSCPGCSGVEELVNDVVPVDGLLSICVLCVVFLCSSCPGCSGVEELVNDVVSVYSGVEELVNDVVPVDGLLSICVLCVVFLCSSCPGCSGVEELVNDVVLVDGLLSTCVSCVAVASGIVVPGFSLNQDSPVQACPCRTRFCCCGERL